MLKCDRCDQPVKPLVVNYASVPTVVRVRIIPTTYSEFGANGRELDLCNKCEAEAANVLMKYWAEGIAKLVQHLLDGYED